MKKTVSPERLRCVKTARLELTRLRAVNELVRSAGGAYRIRVLASDELVRAVCGALELNAQDFEDQDEVVEGVHEFLELDARSAAVVAAAVRKIEEHAHHSTRERAAEFLRALCA